MFNERLNLYSDPMHAELPRRPAPTKAFRPRGCRSIKDGVLENLDYSRFWAQEKQARADAWTGELHPGELAAAGRRWTT